MPPYVGWSQTAHLEGSGGLHFALEWYNTGHRRDLDGDYRLAGGNQVHLGGHVQWVDFDDTEWSSAPGTAGWWKPRFRK